MNVSCDKIRIKYRLKHYLEFTIPFSILPNGYIKNYDVKGLSVLGGKNPVGKYVYSYWFMLEGWESNVICFQGQIDGSGDVDRNVFVIEYNPNKHVLPDFITAFLKVTGACACQILSCDFCYDFYNVPVSEFVFDANGHCQTMTFGTVSGGAAKYLSPKAKDGRVKIYDKEKERKGKDDAEKYKGITRMEVTYKKLDFLLDYVNDNNGLQFWGEDLKRIKDMLEAVQRVKFPDSYLASNKTGLEEKLNPGHLMAIRSFLDNMQYDQAREYVRLCFSSKAPRVKYNEYIRSYDGVTCLYANTGYVHFADDIISCLKEALPKVS